MTERDRYIHCLLDRYRQLPGTLGRVLRDDRCTALALYRRHIGLEVVYQAFLLASARRAFSANQPTEPIRTLRYFLPLITEIADQPPDPAYLRLLEHRLRPG